MDFAKIDFMVLIEQIKILYCQPTLMRFIEEKDMNLWLHELKKLGTNTKNAELLEIIDKLEKKYNNMGQEEKIGGHKVQNIIGYKLFSDLVAGHIKNSYEETLELNYNAMKIITDNTMGIIKKEGKIISNIKHNRLNEKINSSIELKNSDMVGIIVPILVKNDALFKPVMIGANSSLSSQFRDRENWLFVSNMIQEALHSGMLSIILEGNKGVRELIRNFVVRILDDNNINYISHRVDVSSEEEILEVIGITDSSLNLNLGKITVYKEHLEIMQNIEATNKEVGLFREIIDDTLNFMSLMNTDLKEILDEIIKGNEIVANYPDIIFEDEVEIIRKGNTYVKLVENGCDCEEECDCKNSVIDSGIIIGNNDVKIFIPINRATKKIEGVLGTLDRIIGRMI